jgi:hypothetical protein
MTKFYVIAGATRFAVQEVTALTEMEAERIAYEKDPSEWDRHMQSENYEHYEIVQEGEESQYVYLAEGV